jgi:hypothetical protein
MPLTLAHPPALTKTDEAALSDLYRRGTPQNTLHAYERDLLYISAWKDAASGQALTWPEAEAVALRFVLDSVVACKAVLRDYGRLSFGGFYGCRTNSMPIIVTISRSRSIG